MKRNLPFSILLKHERVTRGWSQADLAERIGCDYKTVARWESGECIPRMYHRRRIKDLFGKDFVEPGLTLAEDATTLIISPSNQECP